MRLTVEAGNEKELLHLLKQNSLVTDPVNDDGSTLLHIAAIKGQSRKRIYTLSVVSAIVHCMGGLILYCIEMICNK